MVRAVSITLTIVAAGAAVVFVAEYLGGGPGILPRERIALVPLIAGLAAACLQAGRRGSVSRRRSLWCLALLAIWAGWVSLHGLPRA